ncbi:MAG: rubrerythrin [Anaeroplasmataceae bacterium]
MELKGSKTEKNLQTAFAGESQARNKYTYFASAAKKEGYEQIAAIFEATANNEKEHAKIWFKELGLLSNTEANLISAAAGEHEEWTNMYKDFAVIAREEGFLKLAAKFELVAKIEKEHEDRYLKLLNNVQSKSVFVSDSDTTVWECRNCGHLHTAKNALDKCPVCDHELAFFEKRVINY